MDLDAVTPFVRHELLLQPWSRLCLALGLHSARNDSRTPPRAAPHPLAPLLPPTPQVLASWRAKLERVEGGEQKWGLFRAFKPAEGRDFHRVGAPEGPLA